MLSDCGYTRTSGVSVPFRAEGSQAAEPFQHGGNGVILRLSIASSSTYMSEIIMFFQVFGDQQ